MEKNVGRKALYVLLSKALFFLLQGLISVHLLKAFYGLKCNLFAWFTRETSRVKSRNHNKKANSFFFKVNYFINFLGFTIVSNVEGNRDFCFIWILQVKNVPTVSWFSSFFLLWNKLRLYCRPKSNTRVMKKWCDDMRLFPGKHNKVRYMIGKRSLRTWYVFQRGISTL